MTVRWLSNKIFSTFSTRSEVTRTSADCQTTVFRGIKQLEEFLKKVAERSRNSGRRSRDRRPTVKQRFLDVSNDLKSFSNKSLNGHVTVVGGHANVSRLSNNVFWTFRAIRKIFEKSHWTVTRQWSEVTRPSADCQATFLDVSSYWKFFWKKSLDNQTTVVGGYATVGRLSNNVFWTFQAIRKFFVKSHWTVTRQWSEVTRPSADFQAHICMNKRVRERERVISVTLHTGTAMLCRWPFYQPASSLKLALAGVKASPAHTGRRSAGTASLWIL